MKKLNQKSQAFTLIELLVVISIIALLAGLVVGTATHAKNKARIARAQTELKQLETVIGSYKAAKGIYPPDNGLPLNGTANPGFGTTTNSQLYYELTGTLVLPGANPTYLAANGDQLTQAQLQTLFGVGGLYNSSPMSNEIKNFLGEIKSGQMAAFYYPGSANPPTYTLLGNPIPGPNGIVIKSTTAVPFNPWHYRSSAPVHNPDSYDLWIDIVVSGKTNRISNWDNDPIAVERIENNQP